MSRQLTDATWTELDDAPTLLVPVGSCEQHGPHLPIGTDTFIATAVAERAAAVVDGCMVAPALAVTASGEHQGFPGTLSIGTDATAAALVELARSAGWARRIVFVNGHGGNADAMRAALAVLRHERRPVTAWWPDLREVAEPADLHAGRTETSLMLAIRPDLVRLDRAEAGPVPAPAIAELVEHGVRPLSPSGVLGDPAGASADHGQRLLVALTDQLVAVIGR